MEKSYLGYHYNSVDGTHQNRFLKTIECVKSFLDARASEAYADEVTKLVETATAMNAGEYEYLDIDHGDWVTITCICVSQTQQEEC